MATNKLSDSQIKSIKPTDKQQKVADGGGLTLVVTPTGSKLWQLRYRDGQGRAQNASLGPYPTITLAVARAKREELKKVLLEKKTLKVKEDAGPRNITLKEARLQYWPSRIDLTEGYRMKASNCIEQHIEPVLGRLAMRDISRTNLMDALKPMDAKGLHDYVRKARMWLSAMFEWAIEHEYCDANPCLQIRPSKAFTKGVTEHRASLDLSDVKDLMTRIDVESELQSVLACRLLALTWTRTGELRAMQWDEIEGDVWRIPATRMKRRKDHVVPLSSQALAIIEKMRVRSTGSDYVFPNDRRTDRPMSENAILYLLHRIGYKGKMTGHGFRSVASTWANERGFNRDAIERQLAHVPDDKIRAAYNRAEFLPERKAMMQAFADWLIP